MVSSNTIRLWTEKGLLKSETTLGGHRRFLRSEIDAFLRERQQPPVKRDIPTVLIIEDEPELAQAMAQGLTSAVPGMTVHIATDGFSGGLKASLYQPDFVVLDLKMPGRDGVEVCRMLKDEPQTRNIQIIACTGYADAAQVQAVLAAGAQACLFKPVRSAKLLEVFGLGIKH